MFNINITVMLQKQMLLKLVARVNKLGNILYYKYINKCIYFFNENSFSVILPFYRLKQCKAEFK